MIAKALLRGKLLSLLGTFATGGETADVGTLFRSLAVSNYKQEAEQPVYSPKSSLERHERRSAMWNIILAFRAVTHLLLPIVCFFDTIARGHVASRLWHCSSFCLYHSHLIEAVVEVEVVCWYSVCAHRVCHCALTPAGLFDPSIN